ncbi:hypothetical protein AMECASPLE_005247 [Ameca splendens]|uniref:Uncharacterized protein n=1 Tax=Ameca splendens TaxID=208324 RepID=A0ABV0ZJ56_9TELE
MSLATRRPHSAGSNSCKQNQEEKKNTGLTSCLFTSNLHLFSTTCPSSSSCVVLYTNTRLKSKAFIRTKQCKADHTEIQTPSALQTLRFFFWGGGFRKKYASHMS